LSTHLNTAPAIASAEDVSRAIAALPSPIDFLQAGAEAFFVPVNTNGSWDTGPGKRVLDLAAAVPAMLLLAPLFAVLAVLVKLDSSGPVFFRQTRNGMGGRPFEIFKFRTMRVLENGDDVVQARAQDPRTTRLGRILRRYSLDELPQLLNVIIGDMSLVGPRPHARVHDTYYGAQITDYRHRFAVKPGITGWAQINGHRGPTPTTEIMAARIKHDTWYARHANFALDLKILLRTPLEIFRPRNAY
jgi:lipopolysaccharide/colanic/teichoic acid biosynthesis glycosyltransferase